MIHTMKWQGWSLGWGLALAAVAVLGGGVTANAQFGDGGGTNQHSDATETSIEAKLMEMTSLEFVDEELAHVAQAIGEQHGMSVMLDVRELEDAGLGTDLPVTAAFTGVRLGAVLDLLLRDFDCTYVIRNDVLLITTSEAAAAMLETRVYAVGDLLDHIGGDATMDGLVDVIQSTIEPTTWNIVDGEPPLPLKQSVGWCMPPPNRSVVDGEGAIEGLGQLLIVLQTQQVHREIDALFDKLRAAPGAAVGTSSQTHIDDVPEGRSAWEMRVYPTHGMVSHELLVMLHTVLPELADHGKTQLITVGRDEDKSDNAASGATLQQLGLPRGGWLVVGQRPRLHDRLAELLGEGKLIDERDSPPRQTPNAVVGGGGFGGGGGQGGGGGGFF